jgi:nucleoside-diphosphate-sugar epimerase
MLENIARQFKIDGKKLTGPVLVTGAGGCIGSWIVSMLHDAGIPTVAMDLKKDTSRLGLLMNKEEIAAINWATGDITDTEYVSRTVAEHKPQAFIHLAALQVPFCAADPVMGAKVNVVGLANVMEAVRENGVERFAYASSIAAYGAMDSEKFHPTIYGAYKLCNENFCDVYYKSMGIPSIGLRPGNVYGVARDQGITAKTTQAILAAAAGKPFTIPFSGPISALYTGEVAAAFIKAVSQPVVGAEVFDINGSNTSVEEWMQLVSDINPDAKIKIEGNILPLPVGVDDPLRKHIGDYGSISLAEGTRVTYDAFSGLLANGQLSVQI